MFWTRPTIDLPKRRIPGDAWKLVSWDSISTACATSWRPWEFAGWTLWMTSDPLRITVFGLGKAGSVIAADLARTGAEVHGYDPAPVPTPEGVIRHDAPGPAVEGSRMVLAITASVDAEEAMTQALHEIGQGTIYADLSTAPPSLKVDLSEVAAHHEIDLVDVALMGTVPGSDLATPSLASGPGAARYAAVMNSLG